MNALAYTREADIADRADVTPLMLAVDDGRVDAVKALIAAGANVNARSALDWPPLGETPPAMWFMGHPPSKPRLVGGYTPLRIAKQRGQDEIVGIVLRAGGKD